MWCGRDGEKVCYEKGEYGNGWRIGRDVVEEEEGLMP